METENPSSEQRHKRLVRLLLWFVQFKARTRAPVAVGGVLEVPIMPPSFLTMADLEREFSLRMIAEMEAAMKGER